MADKKRGFGRGVDVAQQQASDEVNARLPLWIKGGAMVENVKFTAATQDVQHKLGRKPRGWMVLRLRAPAGESNVFYEVSSDTAKLTLGRDSVNNVPATVDVWVY